MEVGDKVRYTGSSEAQRNFGTYTGIFSALRIGGIYIVDEIEEHSNHTKIFLRGVYGSFNSVCFEDLQGDKNGTV